MLNNYTFIKMNLLTKYKNLIELIVKEFIFKKNK